MGCVVALATLLSACPASHAQPPVVAASAPADAGSTRPDGPESGVADLLERVEKLEEAGKRRGPTVIWAFADDRVSLAAGVFSSDSDAFGDASGRPAGVALTAHGTALPVFENDGERLLHLGLGYSLRQPRNGLTRFRARPELRIGAATPNVPFVVDTGHLGGSHFQLIGFEFLGFRGPWAVQAEYTLVPLSLRAGGVPVLRGGYAETTYLLTGEHRRYRKENGTVDRLIPARDFIGPQVGQIGEGPGAIELAARVSHLNLTDVAVRGGRTWDVTLGVNWYLNPNLRVSANYVYSRAETPAGAGESHGFGLRLGYEF